MEEVPMNRKVPEFCLGAEYVVLEPYSDAGYVVQ